MTSAPTTLPKEVDELRADWFAHVLQRDITEATVLDTSTGTTGRARVALVGEPGVPETVFVKLQPFGEQQRALVDHTGMGVTEARFYGDLATELPVRVPSVWFPAERSLRRDRIQLDQPRDAPRHSGTGGELRAGDARDALTSLGWWQLLPELHDDESRAAAFAVFRAQGRELANSPAVGMLMAQPYLERVDVAADDVVVAIDRHSRRRGHVRVVVGDVDGMRVLVDRPGRGAAVLGPDDVRLRPIAVPGRLGLHALELEHDDAPATVPEGAAALARGKSQAIGRVALALEMLGAAEGALVLALEHASVREQFGQAIGTFQTVRDLLAWAATGAPRSTAWRTLRLPSTAAAPSRYDEIVKAIAGRNARRACQRSLRTVLLAGDAGRRAGRG